MAKRSKGFGTSLLEAIRNEKLQTAREERARQAEAARVRELQLAADNQAKNATLDDIVALATQLRELGAPIMAGDAEFKEFAQTAEELRDYLKAVAGVYFPFAEDATAKTKPEIAPIEACTEPAAPAITDQVIPNEPEVWQQPKSEKPLRIVAAKAARPVVIIPEPQPPIQVKDIFTIGYTFRCQKPGHECTIHITKEFVDSLAFMIYDESKLRTIARKLQLFAEGSSIGVDRKKAAKSEVIWQIKPSTDLRIFLAKDGNNYYVASISNKQFLTNDSNYGLVVKKAEAMLRRIQEGKKADGNKLHLLALQAVQQLRATKP